MPLGTNEYQVVIEIFTVEDPAIRIQTEAKSFIAKQKWISPEVIYNDQKEELDENQDEVIHDDYQDNNNDLFAHQHDEPIEENPENTEEYDDNAELS